MGHDWYARFFETDSVALIMVGAGILAQALSDEALDPRVANFLWRTSGEAVVAVKRLSIMEEDECCRKSEAGRSNFEWNFAAGINSSAW